MPHSRSTAPLRSSGPGAAGPSAGASPSSPHEPDAGRCAPESELVARDLGEVSGRLERLEIAHVAAEGNFPAAEEQAASDVAAPVVLCRVEVEDIAGAGDVGTDQPRTERDVRRTCVVPAAEG